MNIFKQLSDKGYTVHNKRLLGNPAYTTQETKDKDFLQELGLVLDWFRTEHGIWIHVYYLTEEKCWGWDCYKYEKDNGLLNEPAISFKMKLQSPQEAYSAAFDHILNHLT